MPLSNPHPVPTNEIMNGQWEMQLRFACLPESGAMEIVGKSPELLAAIEYIEIC